MNKCKASLVVMSNLSDIQDTMYNSEVDNKNHKISFCKYIIIRCSGDLTKEIDPNQMWKEFERK
jgi:hypothetical protein